MHKPTIIGKREFIQHTSQYLKLVEEGKALIITHQNKPDLVISKIKTKTLKDLAGLANFKIHGDVNEHVLPEYDQW